MTLPWSTESLASEAGENLKFEPSSCCASACDLPTMFGISICPRETLSRTVSPWCSTAPASGIARDHDVGLVRGVAHGLRLRDDEAELIAAAASPWPPGRSCPRGRRACAWRPRSSCLPGRRRLAGRGRRVVARHAADRERRERARPRAAAAGRAARASASACAASGAQAAVARRSGAAWPPAAARCAWPRPRARARSGRAPRSPCARPSLRPARARAARDRGRPRTRRRCRSAAPGP